MSGFEGSYFGVVDKISFVVIMECKICWMFYDFVEGDDYWQVEFGMVFWDLLGDWFCLNCSVLKVQFMVLEDFGLEVVVQDWKFEEIV